MGRIYKENKIFVNKFAAILKGSLSTRTVSLDSHIPYKDGTTVNLTLSTTMLNNVEFVETSQSLYFCVRLKETERYMERRYTDQSDIDRIAVNSFVNSLSYYSLETNLDNEIRDYLTKKGYSLPKPEDYDSYRMVRDLRSGKYDMKDFPKVITIKNHIQTLKKCDIEITRNPDVFKSLKEFELFPIAYLNGDDADSFRIPTKSSKVRTNTNIFEPVTAMKATQYLKSDANSIMRHLPITKWAVVDIKDTEIDRRVYMSYNYDITD